jgi:outer membrane protein assembly factor BamB
MAGSRRSAQRRRNGVALVAAAALGLAGCGGSHHPDAAAPVTTSTTSDAATTSRSQSRPAPRTPASIALGLPPLGGGPIPGYLMIADRNNGRILILNPRTRHVVWRYEGLADPDDAFFTPDYRAISINEEFDQSIALIGLRRHRVVWSYGHPGVRGSAPGYLSNPDDAYALPNGQIMVADIQNCRVLFINRAHRIVRSIGHAGECAHDPPRSLSSPNGATPLPDGGVLVTEIGGWVDRLDRNGRLLYTVRTPTTYPSDAQLLPNGNLLVAGFNTPGRVDEITRAGRIVWTYGPPSGWGALDRPSLAVRLPNGLIAVTDDWHHRVVAIDPQTKKIVWSYGHLGVPGRAPGYLNKPDGLDLLPAGRVGGLAARSSARATKPHNSLVPGGRVTRIGTLPHPLSKASAVALPGGRLLVLGGLVNGASTDTVLLGRPGALRAAGRLPAPTHDAAAAQVGRSVMLFGGGQASSTDAVVRVDPATGRAAAAGHIDEPLSDLGAVVLGGKVYLVGGYTGSQFASAVLRWDGGGRTTTVARLPAGTRYAGVAALAGRIYVAGGLTSAGETDAVWAVRPGGRPVRVATLPAPEAHAALVALRGRLYLVGGSRILRIDPRGGVSTVARLPRSLTDPAAVASGRRILVVGGGTDAVYAFTPS